MIQKGEQKFLFSFSMDDFIKQICCSVGKILEIVCEVQEKLKKKLRLKDFKTKSNKQIMKSKCPVYETKSQDL